MNLYNAINARMHSGTCPSTGCLGECPAIWVHRRIEDGELVCEAAVYLWSGAHGLKMADVAQWFEAEGCTDVIVSATMHDPENLTFEGVCEDGARPLYVTFVLSAERAATSGLVDTTHEGTKPQPLTEQEVDALLEGVLRAAGSALRYYSMEKHLNDMRNAVRAIERAVLERT